MSQKDERGLKLGRFHTKRLREVYRSAGWPFLDTVEIELIAAGLLERATETRSHQTNSSLKAVTRIWANADSRISQRLFPVLPVLSTV